MKKILFLGVALALCCTVSPPPCVANDVGTPVFLVKKEQVFQAPIVVQPFAYESMALAEATYILISPTQAAPGVAVVPAKVTVPVLAAKVMGGPPRSSPGRAAYTASYCNRFTKHSYYGSRLCHIDPGLRGC